MGEVYDLDLLGLPEVVRLECVASFRLVLQQVMGMMLCHWDPAPCVS